MASVRRKISLIVVLVIGLAIGFLKGYDEGFSKGLKTGEIRELVNQGFTVEDAEYIAENRNRMVTTVEELFGK